MPAKKKHNKVKGTFRSKQRHLERRAQEPAVNQAKPSGVPVQAAPAAVAPAAASVVAAVSKQTPSARVVPAKFNYLNITKELRSIAILFAIVLVIMVAIALLFR